MRLTLVTSILIALFATGCGSTTVDPDPTGGGGSTSSSTSTSTSASTSSSMTSCTPGAVMSCTCHAVMPPGIATCLADGSGYGPCMGADGSDCTCPPGRGDGCCIGDGLC